MCNEKKKFISECLFLNPAECRFLRWIMLKTGRGSASQKTMSSPKIVNINKGLRSYLFAYDCKAWQKLVREINCAPTTNNGE